MSPLHTPYLATDKIAEMRRQAATSHAIARAKEGRDDRTPEPQRWPRLFLGRAIRVLLSPIHVAVA